MDDLISRQQAIDAFNTNINEVVLSGKENAYAVERYLNGVIDEIKQLPPIQPDNNSEVPNSSDCISRQAAINKILGQPPEPHYPSWYAERIKKLPPAEPKRGKWIIDRSGAYCCSECMEPCAGYVMMKPRDKFCKMCGSRNEVTT